MVKHQLIVLDDALRVGVFGVELWSLVFKNDLAVEDVSDDFIAEDFDFGGDPLFTVVSIRLGVGAVLGKEFALHFDVGAWAAKVQGCAGVFSVSTEELDFDRAREVLIERHCFGGLAMKHHTAVTDRPAGAAGGLIADKTIFDSQTIL